MKLEISKLEIELAKTKGDLVSRKSMVETGRKVGAIFSACLRSMESTLPPSLAGRDELGILEALRAEFDSTTEAFLTKITKIQ